MKPSLPFLIFLMAFIFIFPFVSSSDFGYNYLETSAVTQSNNTYINNTYINQTVNVTVNTTQFDSSDPIHIKESWLTSFINYLIGLNPFNYYNSTTLPAYPTDVTLTTCYQESVNVSNQSGIDTANCGLKYTGSYSETLTSSGSSDVFINYTKPSLSTINSKWLVKGGFETINFSLSSCWNAYPDKIVLKLVSSNVILSSPFSTINCYDGSQWVQLKRYNGTGGSLALAGFSLANVFDGIWTVTVSRANGNVWVRASGSILNSSFYEEAMYWDVSTFARLTGANFTGNITAPNICYANGTNCPAQNPFDQVLNTTSNVTFDNAVLNKLVFTNGTKKYISPADTTDGISSGTHLEIRGGNSNGNDAGDVSIVGGENYGSIGNGGSVYAKGSDNYEPTQEGGGFVATGGNGKVMPSNGGPIKLIAGNAEVSGSGGLVDIFGGDTVLGNAGTVTIKPGNSDSGNGGDLNLWGGNSIGGNPGAIFIRSMDNGDSYGFKINTSNLLTETRIFTLPDISGMIVTEESAIWDNYYLKSNPFGFYNSTTLPDDFLKLNQTTPQTVTGGMPNFLAGLQGDLYDYAVTPLISIDTDGRILYDATSPEPRVSVDWGVRSLYDDNAQDSVNWQNRKLFSDGGENIRYNWQNNQMFDSYNDPAAGGLLSIDIGNRILYANDGTTPALSWSSGNVLIGTTVDDGVNKLQVNGNGRFMTQTTDGFVKFTNTDGTLGVDTTSYCQSNGTNCPAQNPFNQSLNTTDNVSFNSVTTFDLGITGTIGSGSIETLVVAGGGPGSFYDGGGGGGGGVIHEATHSIGLGTYPVVVGAGGFGDYYTSAYNGEDSTFDGLIAKGGGVGAIGGGATYYPNTIGGSGGGGSGTPGFATTGKAGIAGQGNAGGDCGDSDYYNPAGGGGGAGEVGHNSVALGGDGQGGDGLEFTQFAGLGGSPAGWFGGGGGGGSYGGATAVGGKGGGGTSSNSNSNPDDGIANTGGGGGGGGMGGTDPSHGGSGIVIIKYLTADMVATGGSVSYDGAYTIHTFLTNGTFEITSIYALTSITKHITLTNGEFNFSGTTFNDFLKLDQTTPQNVSGGMPYFTDGLKVGTDDITKNLIVGTSTAATFGSYKLNIGHGAGQLAAGFFNNDPTGYDGFVFWENDVPKGLIQQIGSNFDGIRDNDYEFYNLGAGGDMNFVTTGGEGIRIKDNANVLIGGGVDDALHKLQVNGNMKVGISDYTNPTVFGDALNGATGYPHQIEIGNDDGSSVILTGQDGTHNLVWAWQYNADPALAVASFGTYSYNNPMWLDGQYVALQSQNSGGKVLIGTTTDNTLDKLQVAGNVNAFTQGYDTSIGQVIPGSNGLLLNDKTSGTLIPAGLSYDYTNGILDYSINVPQLGAGENVNLPGGIMRFDTRLGAGSQGFYIYGYDASSAHATGGYRFYVDTETGTTMLSQEKGNVLVGTTTDDGINKLQVNGKIKFGYGSIDATNGRINSYDDGANIYPSMDFSATEGARLLGDRGALLDLSYNPIFETGATGTDRFYFDGTGTKVFSLIDGNASFEADITARNICYANGTNCVTGLTNLSDSLNDSITYVVGSTGYINMTTLDARYLSGGYKSFYFTNHTSDVAGMYNTTHSLADVHAAGATITGSANDGITTLVSYLAPAEPTYAVSAGTRYFYLDASVSNVAKITQLRALIYRTNLTGGNKTLLRNSSLSIPLTVVQAEYIVTAPGGDLIINSSERILFEIQSEKESGGPASTVSLYVEDATLSRLDVPSPVGVTDTRPFARLDGANFTGNVTAINIYPTTTNTYSLGSSLLRWLKGWFSGLDVQGTTLLNGNTTIGNATGNITISNDGNLQLNGEATQWDDVAVPISGSKTETAKPPLFDETGMAYYFENVGAGNEQYIFGTFEMPHGWKLGSNLHCHIHTHPSTTNVGNATFELSYTWTNIGAVEGSPTAINLNVSYNGTVGLTQIPEWADINGNDKTLSSIFEFRLKRLSAAASDTFTGNAYVDSIGCHLEKDSIGSKEELVK